MMIIPALAFTQMGIHWHQLVCVLTRNLLVQLKSYQFVLSCAKPALAVHS